MLRLRLASVVVRGFIGLALAMSGCGDRGSVTFNLKAPANPLFNPVAHPELVSEYDLRTANGTVIGIASAVQGSAQSGNGLLPLGALMPPGMPEDVYVTALSGGNLIGMARIRDVVIKAGSRAIYDAELRKPLVFVGSTMPPEATGGMTPGSVAPVKILDPIESRDLARTAMSAPSVAGGMTAGASTWDGRFLVVAQGPMLTAFDNGLGHNVAGSFTLPFAPARVVVAPRDLAIVALDPGNGTNGSLAIISDVASFVGNPGGAAPKIVPMTRAVARTATFSPDGAKLYVLTGGPNSDPCSPGATTTPNAIEVFTLDGNLTGMFPLAGFASDLAVDPQSGLLVIADVAGKQISTMDPTTGATTKLLGNLTCPSAVRVVNGTVFAVTSDRDPMKPDSFVLQRVPFKGGAAAATSFGGPNYNIPIDSMPSGNGDIGMALLPVRPVSIEAYELAITPDGNRAEFATRAVYNEAGTTFVFSGENCTANFNIVEYGLFAVDVRTGNASYEMHAQLVVKGSSACVVCKLPSPFPDQQVGCMSTPGDQPVGLAASFGQ